MRAYARGRGCLMEFLQQALDDPDPGPCGRCSVCTGRLPAPGREIDPGTVEAVRMWLRGADTVLEPRKRWPAGAAGGRKGAIVGATTGRALTYADTPGWLQRDHRAQRAGRTAARRRGHGHGRGADSLETVLERSAGRGRPDPVAPTPVLVRDLAERIAAIGKLELVDALTVSGPRPPDDVPSGPRVEALLTSFAVVQGLPSLPDGPVLLVDDTYRTGWTMTVAAALLREAGASEVMPLVVQQCYRSVPPTDQGDRAASLSLRFEEALAAAEAGGDVDDLGELAAGRGVGGEEAGEAGEDERALLGARRATAWYWRTAASNIWYQWNSASSRSSAWPSAATSRAGSPPPRR